MQLNPVAITFLDNPPTHIERFAGAVPAGCAFWRLAAEGQTFWTAPQDHYHCAVGCHTHNIPLPDDRAAELDATLGLMTEHGYLRMEEVPQIPRLQTSPKAIVYSPLAQTPADPDVAPDIAPDIVLMAGPAARLMLVQEAAQRAGVDCGNALFGRPTCMALPAAMANGVTASLGCVGNRVYTDADPGTLYVAVPGRDIVAVVDELPTIVAANEKLREYHQGRQQAIGA